MKYLEQMQKEINVPALRQWDFEIIGARSEGRVFRLETDMGQKCLHVREVSSDMVSHLFLLMEHLSQQGLKRIPRFIRTRYGDPYLKVGSHFYWVSDWIHGRHINIRDRNDTVKSIREMADFHIASKGFFLHGEKEGNFATDKWGSMLLCIADQITDLMLQIKSPPYFAEDLRLMAKNAVSASKILISDDYSYLRYQFYKEESFCHGAFNNKHIIMGKSGEIHITGFIHWKRDVRLRDLADFLLSTGAENDWDNQLCQKLISSYHQISPLFPAEMGLLGQYLGFPFGFWELLGELSGKNAGAKETKRRLESYLQKEEKKRQCLRHLFQMYS